jgi:hypothetical protein
MVPTIPIIKLFVAVVAVTLLSPRVMAQRLTLNASPKEQVQYPGKIKSAWHGPAATITVDINAGTIDITGSNKRLLKIVSRDSTYKIHGYKYSWYFSCIDPKKHSCTVSVDLPDEYFTKKGVVALGYSNRFYIYSIADQGK